MAGKLYGVGIGPGDPELLTLKAVRIIRKSQVIAVPGKVPSETIAYQILKKAEIINLEEKEVIGIYMPMTKDEKKLSDTHKQGICDLKKHLDDGKEIAFLTLGDPVIYSTYMYLHCEIEKLGYRTEIINGIPSFCAAAARVGVTLGEKAEQIHVIPASYQIEEALELNGTKILMKSGREYPKVKEILKKYLDHADRKQRVIMVEDCGMTTEHIYDGIENFPEMAGYYTLIFIKDEV